MVNSMTNRQSPHINYPMLEAQSNNYTKALLRALRCYQDPFTLQDIAGYSDLTTAATKKLRAKLKNSHSLIVHVANQEGWTISLEGADGQSHWTFKKDKS